MIKEKENYVCPECMVLHFEVQNIMAGTVTKTDPEDGGDDNLGKPGGYFEEITWEDNVWDD